MSLFSSTKEAIQPYINHSGCCCCCCWYQWMGDIFLRRPRGPLLPTEQMPLPIQLLLPIMSVRPLIETWTHLLMAWNRPGTVKNPQSSQTCFWNLTILCYAVHKWLPRPENFNPTRHYCKLNYWKWKIRDLQLTKDVATVCTNSIFQSIVVSSCFKGRKEVQFSTCNVYQMVELLSGIMKLLKQNAGN